METGNRKGCGTEASHRGHSIRRREQDAAQEDTVVPRRGLPAQVTPGCTCWHPIWFARRNHVLSALVVLLAQGCVLPDLQRISDASGGSENSQVAGNTGTGSSAGSTSVASGGSASTDGGTGGGGNANGSPTTSDTGPRGGGGSGSNPSVSAGGASTDGGTLGDPANSTSGGVIISGGTSTVAATLGGDSSVNGGSGGRDSSGGGTSGGTSNGGVAGSGTECQGCSINGECYAHGVPNRANPCQHCDATATRTTWSNKNGTACDDGLYCNGPDSCSKGTCSVHLGDPCAPSDACNETNKSCCKASTTRVCTNGNVHAVDACGKDLGQVEACATSNCANGACVCPPGWTGKDCLRCVRYVHPAGSSLSKGLSWSDPYRSLSTALSDKTCEIWVAEGTYTPGSTRDATFTLSPGQTLYGGFVRYQTSPDQRDIAAHPTILSGDIGVVNDIADNSYHVVTMGDQAVLDGVTITRGNSTGASPLRGGAIFAPAATVTVRNTTIRESGIAIQESDGNMTFLNCAFEKNERAIFITDTSITVDVSGCQFRDNDDGIYVTMGHAIVRDSVFGAHTKNAINMMSAPGFVNVYSSRFQSTVKNSGGVLKVDGSFFSNNAGVSVFCGVDSDGCTISSSVFESNTGVSIQANRASISGCRFSNNSATSIRAVNFSTTISNSVFYGNTAPAINAATDQGSLDVISSAFFGNSAVVSSGERPTRFLSCILWGNGSTPISGPATLEYNDIEGPAATGTNFSADPLFVNTTAGAVDLRLRPGSPCIDRAPVNASIPVKDFLGNERYDVPTIANVNGTTTDLGPYEYRP